jgi:hypothetical protein
LSPVVFFPGTGKSPVGLQGQTLGKNGSAIRDRLDSPKTRRTATVTQLAARENVAGDSRA